MRWFAWLVFFSINSQTYCQVGDIIGGIGDISGGSGCGESCGDACAEGCLTGVYLNCANLIFSSGLFEGISLAQRDLLDKKARLSRIVSLDLSYHVGLSWDLTDTSFSPTYNSTLHVPSARLNWGLFGLEYRFDRFSDPTGWAHNNDILLNFNLAQQEKINYRLSAGVSYFEGFNTKNEVFVQRLYSLSSMSFDLYLSNQKFQPSVDVRLATDGFQIPRLEVFPKLGFRLYHSQNLDMTLDLAYNFRRYNQSQNFHILLAGLRFNVN
jgi:hypothetical protein